MEFDALKMDTYKCRYGQNRSSFYGISIEFLSPQKCEGGWFFELKIPQILEFYNVKLVILEHCGYNFYLTKYKIHGKQ